MTHFAFHPNRDSGSIRSHRNPDTKRRHGCSELPKLRIQKPRPVKSFMRAALPELSTGLFDVSFAAIRRGWDPGDLLTLGDPILVESDPREDEWSYPETPEWAWDELYAASLGIEWYD